MKKKNPLQVFKSFLAKFEAGERLSPATKLQKKILFIDTPLLTSLYTPTCSPSTTYLILEQQSRAGCVIKKGRKKLRLEKGREATTTTTPRVRAGKSLALIKIALPPPPPASPSCWIQLHIFHASERDMQIVLPTPTPFSPTPFSLSTHPTPSLCAIFRTF